MVLAVFPGNSLGGASHDTGSAPNAMFLQLHVGPGSRGSFPVGDDAAEATCHTLLGYQPLVEGKGSESRRVSRMALRPVAGKQYAVAFFIGGGVAPESGIGRWNDSLTHIRF